MPIDLILILHLTFCINSFFCIICQWKVTFIRTLKLVLTKWITQFLCFLCWKSLRAIRTFNPFAVTHLKRTHTNFRMYLTCRLKRSICDIPQKNLLSLKITLVESNKESTKNSFQFRILDNCHCFQKILQTSSKNSGLALSLLQVQKIFLETTDQKFVEEKHFHFFLEHCIIARTHHSIDKNHQRNVLSESLLS